MFIAIEGTDASGKTSLCAEVTRQLEARGPVEILHKGRPEEETRKWALCEYAISIERADFAKNHVVADRWHWGEVTYAPLKRPHTCIEDSYGLLGIPGWRWVEMFMASRGMAQFWLYQPLDVIQYRLRGRGDDFVSEEDLEVIIELYKKAAASVHTLAGMITPDPYSIDDVPNVAADIIKTAELAALSVQHLAPFPEYIGSPRPSALLVGDDRNLKDVTILPFMPVNKNSGDYLMSALPDALWREIGIVNSDDVRDDRCIDLWRALGSPTIVALGRKAAARLKMFGISDDDVIVVPHPQYVRRFHHHDRTEYGSAIERCIRIGADKEDKWILR
jgi:thymidylate kinase